MGGNLHIISYQYFSQSTVSAPAQYISQFYTAVYYLPGLLQRLAFRNAYMGLIIKFCYIYLDYGICDPG